MSLNETFEIVDVSPIDVEFEEIKPISIYDYKTIAPKEEQVDADYNSARDNLYTLLQLGEDALIHSLSVAKQSEHPRAFEVVGQLITQLASINHQLLDVHKKKLDLKKQTPEKEAKTITNNSIFVGSTSDLQKMLAEMKK